MSQCNFPFIPLQLLNKLMSTIVELQKTISMKNKLFILSIKNELIMKFTNKKRHVLRSSPSNTSQVL